MVYCVRCGAKNPDDAAVCAQCGRPLMGVERGRTRHETEMCFGLPSHWGSVLVGLFIVALGLSILFQSWLGLRDFWPLVLIFLFEIKRIRYTMPAFPMLALMASYGLREITNKEIRKFAALCAVTCSLVVAVFAYLPLVQKMSSANLKAAGEYLDTLETDTCEVFVLPLEDPVLNSAVSVPLLDIFTRKAIHYDYHPPSSPPLGEEKSPLRFTWEYKNPSYYSSGPAGKGRPAVVIISDKPGRELPAAAEESIKNLSARKDFTLSDDLFTNQTLVTVYH